MDPHEERAWILRIYVGDSDKHGHEALYKHLVKLLRERGIWGATASRGILGYGATAGDANTPPSDARIDPPPLHAVSPLRLAQDLPIVIEAIDHPEKIEAVLPEIEALVAGGLIVTCDARVHSRSPRA